MEPSDSFVLSPVNILCPSERLSFDRTEPTLRLGLRQFVVSRRLEVARELWTEGGPRRDFACHRGGPRFDDRNHFCDERLGLGHWLFARWLTRQQRLLFTECCRDGVSGGRFASHIGGLQRIGRKFPSGTICVIRFGRVAFALLGDQFVIALLMSSDPQRATRDHRDQQAESDQPLPAAQRLRRSEPLLLRRALQQAIDIECDAAQGSRQLRFEVQVFDECLSQFGRLGPASPQRVHLERRELARRLLVQQLNQFLIGHRDSLVGRPTLIDS